jgi:hypothetical protein
VRRSQKRCLFKVRILQDKYIGIVPQSKGNATCVAQDKVYSGLRPGGGGSLPLLISASSARSWVFSVSVRSMVWVSRSICCINFSIMVGMVGMVFSVLLRAFQLREYLALGASSNRSGCRRRRHPLEATGGPRSWDTVGGPVVAQKRRIGTGYPSQVN